MLTHRLPVDAVEGEVTAEDEQEGPMVAPADAIMHAVRAALRRLLLLLPPPRRLFSRTPGIMMYREDAGVPQATASSRQRGVCVAHVSGGGNGSWEEGRVSFIFSHDGAPRRAIFCVGIPPLSLPGCTP